MVIKACRTEVRSGCKQPGVTVSVKGTRGSQRRQVGR